MAIPINCHHGKRRAFLDHPASFQSIPSAKLKTKDCSKTDYRIEIPQIKQRIIQSNSDHFSVVQRHLRECTINLRNPPDSRFKLVLNLIGIHSISKSFLKTERPFHVSQEPLIIETGNIIQRALRNEGYEAYYFENFEKIIVLSSSNLSAKALQSIFDGHAFKAGFYPIVDEERTEFDDLTIHISDVPENQKTSFMLPAKQELYAFLENSPSVSTMISPQMLSLIAEKLANKLYTQEETIYKLAKDFLGENILLGYSQVIALESAIINLISQ